MLVLSWDFQICDEAKSSNDADFSVPAKGSGGR
jgi:hypothetical protein